MRSPEYGPSVEIESLESSSGGVTLRGKPIHKSTLHQILRKRIYKGDFDWDGETYRGVHEPIVDRETWQKVQTMLNKRSENKRHRIKRDFTFSGFVSCGHCGCQLVGELKKGRYIYYHCTGFRGKCSEPHTREENMFRQFTASLRTLVIPRQVLDWLSETVSPSDTTERAAREKTIKHLEEQRRRIGSKLEAMYEDKLEGRITVDFFDRRANELREHDAELLRRINEIHAAEPAPIEKAINLMELTSRRQSFSMTNSLRNNSDFSAWFLNPRPGVPVSCGQSSKSRLRVCGSRTS